MTELGKERDVILSRNEFAYVQDMTKGDINMYVGPTRFSLSNTERLIKVNPETRRVSPDDLPSGIQPFVFIESSQYAEIENPRKEDNTSYMRGPNPAVDLNSGKKIVKSGPDTFPLWPGQIARVVDGHRLREDQFLIIRAYDKASDGNHQIGEERIIKGTDTRFFIPETGWEVVKSPDRTYVRDAVKLQNAEYCVLLKSDGNQRYVSGPAVVFPETGETFISAGGSKNLNAFKLRKDSGLHVYVKRDFELSDNDESNNGLVGLINGGKFKVGQELFISGKDGLFFPSENLEVKAEVKPICLSENEGLYVRDIESGKIKTVAGPRTYLPDPTKENIVPRVLEAIIEGLYKVSGRDSSKAVAINIPPNTAVMVSSKDKRRVLTGPQNCLLDYNEDLEVLSLSTGKPKTDEKKLDTAFLQIEGNKVSDIIPVETKDHVELKIKASYRISFGGEPKKWFDVNDYVGLLCDHLSSVIRGTVRNTPLEEFYTNSTELIRSSVLGSKGEDGARQGKRFKENGMHVYDLEVLGLEVLNKNVSDLISKSQMTAIETELQKRKNELDFDCTQASEKIKQATLDLKSQTLQKELSHLADEQKLSLSKQTSSLELNRMNLVRTAEDKAEAARILANQDAEASRQKSELKISELDAEAKAFAEKMSAITPQLTAAITRFGDQQVLSEAIKQVGDLSLYKGMSVEEVIRKLVGGMPLGTESAEALIPKPLAPKQK